jgi:hypothetical protein
MGPGSTMEVLSMKIKVSILTALLAAGFMATPALAQHQTRSYSDSLGSYENSGNPSDDRSYDSEKTRNESQSDLRSYDKEKDKGEKHSDDKSYESEKDGKDLKSYESEKPHKDLNSYDNPQND